MIKLIQKDGFITLISTLVVGAVGLAIALSVVLLGLGSSRTSLSQEHSSQAMALSDMCAEEALMQIRDSVPFTGTGSITAGEGSCSYSVTSEGGQNRTINASSTIDTTVRKIHVIINSITPDINIVSWQEVADL